MGGVEVLNAGDGWKGDDVYQLLIQAALVRGGVAASFAADLSKSGSSSLDARYISFGSMIIELLDYHSDEAVLQRSLFPKFSESNVAPSVAGNMHISFNVRPEKNLNEFVVALEKSAHQQGYNEVICNRLVPVKIGVNGHADVKGIPVTDNSFEVKSGDFQGWSLAYCKGPDGEQLEFNQVKGKRKKYLMMHYEHIYLVVQISVVIKNYLVCGVVCVVRLMCGDTLYNFKKYFMVMITRLRIKFYTCILLFFAFKKSEKP